jgi:FAD dependent oxidoreductase
LGLTQNHPLAREQSSDFKVKPYDIPLRSLIAADVDGLTMAGRCISGDFFAHASYRVTGNAVPMARPPGRWLPLLRRRGACPIRWKGRRCLIA